VLKLCALCWAWVGCSALSWLPFFLEISGHAGQREKHREKLEGKCNKKYTGKRITRMHTNCVQLKLAPPKRKKNTRMATCAYPLSVCSLMGHRGLHGHGTHGTGSGGTGI
jgi:hypothetical protein